MRLINNKKEIITKVVQKCIGRLSWFKTGKMPGIIFDSGAEAGFPALWRGFQTVDKALLLQGFAIVGTAFLI